MIAKETALIFIEFQNDFCKPGGKLHDLVKEELARVGTIPNAVRLLQGARAKGCRIIHCPFTLDKNWVAEKGSVGILEGINQNDIFALGTWGHQIISELAPIDGEPVLSGKRSLSAFSNTNLQNLLESAGIRNLIVCGFLSNICAQATAWSAYDLGYQVRMIPEACCATNVNLQEYVESQISPILGGAFTVDSFLENLK
ncbi:MAG: cysteine hydrolase [Planctomycetia bacterium]|nr:cysteine hydrolase [Planctomycetia bacterium]